MSNIGWKKKMIIPMYIFLFLMAIMALNVGMGRQGFQHWFASGSCFLLFFGGWWALVGRADVRRWLLGLTYVVTFGLATQSAIVHQPWLMGLFTLLFLGMSVWLRYKKAAKVDVNLSRLANIIFMMFWLGALI